METDLDNYRRFQVSYYEGVKKLRSCRGQVLTMDRWKDFWDFEIEKNLKTFLTKAIEDEIIIQVEPNKYLVVVHTRDEINNIVDQANVRINLALNEAARNVKELVMSHAAALRDFPYIKLTDFASNLFEIRGLVVVHDSWLFLKTHMHAFAVILTKHDLYECKKVWAHQKLLPDWNSRKTSSLLWLQYGGSAIRQLALCRRESSVPSEKV